MRQWTSSFFFFLFSFFYSSLLYFLLLGLIGPVDIGVILSVCCVVSTLTRFVFLITILMDFTFISGVRACTSPLLALLCWCYCVGAARPSFLRWRSRADAVLVLMLLLCWRLRAFSLVLVRFVVALSSGALLLGLCYWHSLADVVALLCWHWRSVVALSCWPFSWCVLLLLLPCRQYCCGILCCLAVLAISC